MTTQSTNGSDVKESEDMEGSRLSDHAQLPLAHRIEHFAAAHPTRTMLTRPRSSNPEHGWSPITYRAFADAVNAAAQMIHDRVKSHSSEEFPTVAYIGPNDVRYPIIMVAAVKAGCQALFLSPRNSMEAQLSLLEKTKCLHLWFSGPFQRVIDTIAKEKPMKTLMVPSTDEWLGSAAPAFPYKRSLEEANWDPLVVLHTSGSTGIPKPVVLRQGILYALDQFRRLPPRNGVKYQYNEYGERSKRMFIMLPFFHAAGIIGAFCMMHLTHGIELALPIPDKPLTSDLFVKSIECSESNTAFTVPSILEDLGGNEYGISLLKKLSSVIFGGGSLSETFGNTLISRGVQLSPTIATTEHIPWGLYWQKDPKNWQYFVVDSEAMGADWRPHDPENGIYELVVKRKYGSEPGDQAVFYNFPDWEEYAPGDLFKAHQTEPDNWMFYGRKDNIIVFSNGEKLNPVTIEDTITGHPLINGAFVVGAGRFQAALILEPAVHPKTEKEAAGIIDQVWPSVEEINERTVAHGRISRQLVSLSDPDIPFPRASKGTVQRGLATRSYEKHIAAMYDRADLESGQDVAAFDLSNPETLTKSITQAMTENLKVLDVEPQTEFFSIGIDSLQVLTLSKILHAGLKAAGEEVDSEVVASRVIYSRPTAEQLAAYIFSQLHSTNGTTTDDLQAAEMKLCKDLVAKYTRDMPGRVEGKPAPLDGGQTVMLTGTTGSLGAYMLDILCKSPHVATVIAVNRGDDGGKSRQPEISASRGLSTDFAKVEFLSVDVSQSKFGVGEAEYNSLAQRVDRIIHNAWPVNFNLSVTSFEPYIRGVRDLADFAATCPRAAPLVFLSSIGTVTNWTEASPVPESQLSDFRLTSMGYGQSKLAGSLVLDEAAKQSGVPTASIRVGQIAGPKAEVGKWNPQEFLPSLIASSACLGMLPESIGPQSTVDWVPIEDVAGLVLDIAGVTETKPVSDISGYFHCVNPQTIQWSDLAAAVLDYHSPRITKLVSLEEWVAALEKSAEGTPDLEKNPALKLLDTYRGLVKAAGEGQSHVNLSMTRTKTLSKTATAMGPVTPEMMRRWCGQWKF